MGKHLTIRKIAREQGDRLQFQKGKKYWQVEQVDTAREGQLEGSKGKSNHSSNKRKQKTKQNNSIVFPWDLVSGVTCGYSIRHKGQASNEHY